jgi:hypothetical protein
MSRVHEAWNWYNEHVGKEKCAIVDTWRSELVENSDRMKDLRPADT